MEASISHSSGQLRLISSTLVYPVTAIITDPTIVGHRYQLHLQVLVERKVSPMSLKLSAY
jgi:hypothetical protein